MSSESNVVIHSAHPEATQRLLPALEAYAEAHPRSAAFEVLTSTEQPFLGGLSVVVGTVNHLETETLLGVVQTALTERGEPSPVTVLISHEDDFLHGHSPKPHRLTLDGFWV